MYFYILEANMWTPKIKNIISFAIIQNEKKYLDITLKNYMYDLYAENTCMLQNTNKMYQRKTK